jgi:hypothetical protein
MKPNLADVVKDVADRLSRDVVPALTGFAANNVAMSAAMLTMVSEKWDSAAANLVEENTGMIALLRQGDAAGIMAHDVSSYDPLADLRISALEALNARLRGALIDLHIAVEQSDKAEARALDAAIWKELKLSTDRRRVSSANF